MVCGLFVTLLACRNIDLSHVNLEVLAGLAIGFGLPALCDVAMQLVIPCKSNWARRYLTGFSLGIGIVPAGTIATVCLGRLR